jgi:hypothetical protein
MNRRDALRTAGAAALATATTTELLRPVKAVAADAKRIRIQNIETFYVQLPNAGAAPPAAAGGFGGDPSRLTCTRVTTESGVRGYSFLGGSTVMAGEAKKALAGEDLFAVEQHLKRGLINWSPVEEAIWDTIGRVAGQPVHRLLGGARTTTLPVYLTYVWPGAADQSQVTPKQQAEQAVLVKKAGFKAMKIRIFRPNYMDDVAACEEILAVGGPGFRVMVDRTATQPGLWTYPQGAGRCAGIEEGRSVLARRALRSQRLRRASEVATRSGHYHYRRRGLSWSGFLPRMPGA